jgi:hypothetical protein
LTIYSPQADCRWKYGQERSACHYIIAVGATGGYCGVDSGGGIGGSDGSGGVDGGRINRLWGVTFGSFCTEK